MDLHDLPVCGVVIVASGCDSRLSELLGNFVRPPRRSLSAEERVELIRCRPHLRDRSRRRRWA
ncbi:MAG: hypothetical protein ACYCTE_14840, partial [Acidimicrobiales bacterium]